MAHKKKILVTGANGLLGNAIAKRLIQDDYEIFISTRDANFIITGAESVCIDWNKVETVDNAKKIIQKLDVIVHCASAMANSVADDIIIDVNTTQMYSLLEFASFTKVEQVVYLSGASVYGCVSTVASESSDVNPMNNYVLSKLVCEKILAKYAVENKFNATILRVSACYGVGMRHNTVIKTFCMNAFMGCDIVLLGSGKRSQDFVYKTDVADAVSRVLKVYEINGCYNIALGADISMLELAKLCIKCNGNNQKIRFENVDPQESCRFRYDISKAENDFGYKPVVNIAKGIEMMVNGFKTKQM